MKICMIATRHSLDDARVVHKEAISLINEGYEVCLVLSCNESYEYLRNDGSLIATGKPGNGEVDYRGIKVFGLPKRKGLFGKLRMYMEFSKLAAGLEANVYHAHEPDLSLAIALRTKSILLKYGFCAYVVHDMHEYPPGVADKALKFLKYPILLAHILWNKLSMNWVDHVFTANNIVRGYALVLSHKKKVDVLYNGPILKLFKQTKPRWPIQGEKVVLCHEGALLFNRGLREMIYAVDKLRDKVSLKIIGDVFNEEREWLMKEIEKRGLQENIIITGWLPYEDVGESLKDCHVGLILFRDCINNRMAGPPNKLFNYMNAGLPILSVDFPEMRSVILDEDCGILMADQSVESIIDGIEVLLSDIESKEVMGENGQRAIRERYSWECMEKKLVSTYKMMSNN